MPNFFQRTTRKMSCPSDLNAYIEQDEQSRTFTITVALEKDFCDCIPNEIISGTPTMLYNEEKKSAQITLKVSENQSEAQKQVTELSKLLAGLNDYSNISYFYLMRICFFNEQFKNFVNTLHPSLAKPSHTQQSFEYSSPDMAF